MSVSKILGKIRIQSRTALGKLSMLNVAFIAESDISDSLMADSGMKSIYTLVCIYRPGARVSVLTILTALLTS